VPRGKVEAKATVWSDRVRRWKDSGLTAAQFAAQEGLPRPQALSWWAHHLSRPPKDGKKPPTLKLVRVEPVVSASSDVTNGGVEIRRDGYCVGVSPGFDEETLRRVLVVMEEGR
jgi:hypothetical protein